MRLHQPALITLAALFVVTACSDRAADRQRAEEAVARGEAPAAAASEPAPDAAVSACTPRRTVEHRRRPLHGHPRGLCRHRPAAGSRAPAASPTASPAGECTGFGGMRWNGSQCAGLLRTDINNIGLKRSIRP